MVWPGRAVAPDCSCSADHPLSSDTWSVVATGLALLVVTPALVRLMLSEPLMALASLMPAVSIALWGQATGALCRNSRLFELALLIAGYVSVQGVWPW